MSLLPVATAAVDAASDSAMAAADRASLRQAIRYLEHRSLATRLSQLLGRQMSNVGKLLPAQFTEIVERAAEGAIKAALAAAVRSANGKDRHDRRHWHKTAATLSGAVGGAFGMASLPIELPVSTLLMLRSIASIAKAEGEDLATPEAAFACLQVFALGGQGDAQTIGPEASEETSRKESSAMTESGYFAVRAALAQSVSEAARFLVERGMAEEGAPAVLRFVAQIATRFGVVVSQKVAAQAVPILGAAGGAAINYAFIDHFQALARGHFTVRRLERIYGPALVRSEYDAALREAAGTFG